MTETYQLVLKKTYKWHPVQKWHLIFINLNFILCQNLSCKLIQSHWRNKISQCNNTVLSHEVMSICGERIIVTYRRMHFIPSSWIWPSDYGENYFESCYYFLFCYYLHNLYVSWVLSFLSWSFLFLLFSIYLIIYIWWNLVLLVYGILNHFSESYL